MFVRVISECLLYIYKMIYIFGNDIYTYIFGNDIYMSLPKLTLTEENVSAVLQRCITAGGRFCIANTDLKMVLFYELCIGFMFPLISVFPLENTRWFGKRREGEKKLVLQVSW